mmetsp:Transcript_7803/g.16074  ORF Transcript_7803/g.16074 Transcript_7803/m.16074 type:complete len:80 (+) Transcript_7803:486-725(+)
MKYSRYILDVCSCPSTRRLPTLEQKNCNLAKIKIYEMLCIVCHVTSEVSSNNDMPSWVKPFVKFFLDIRSDIFFYVKFG